jgi:CheY-like chemotaxis protein
MMRFKPWDLPEMETKKVNILVVDDDENTRAYLAKILSAKHWHVDTAADGPEALEFVQNQSYDAVVLDYRMPGMDGAEVCRRIREIQPEAREIFLTGYPLINTVFPAIDAGAERVLAKPVNPEELVHVVEEQLADV